MLIVAFIQVGFFFYVAQFFYTQWWKKHLLFSLAQ